MRRLGGSQLAMDGKVSAFDRDTIKPLGGGGKHFTARPTMAESRIVREVSGYELAGVRHRWKKAYAFFVDSPYATVSRSGRFQIENVPVGTWTVDVWHEAYKPLKGTFSIEITKDATTELAVEFQPPPELTPPAKK